MAEEEKKGFLSRIANKVFSIETFLVTIPLALVTGYAGNMIWDFGFFDVIHSAEGLSPEAAQWKMLMNKALDPMHDALGFTTGDGFLQSSFMDSVFNFFDVEYDVAADYTPTQESFSPGTNIVEDTPTTQAPTSFTSDTGLPILLPPPGA